MSSLLEWGLIALIFVGWNPVVQLSVWNRDDIIISGKSPMIKDTFGMHMTCSQCEKVTCTLKSAKEAVVIEAVVIELVVICH